MWSELAGREGLCRKTGNDEGESWGNAEEARGNKNPAEPWGLRDENIDSLSVTIIKYVLKIWNI